MQILFIDLDKKNCEFIEPFFLNEGFSFHFYHDYASAIDYHRRNPVDLILIDVTNPLLNGWDICRDIKQNSQHPAVILCGYNSIDSKVRAFELGADDYVAKPFDPRELIVRVKARLQDSRDDFISRERILSVGDLVVDINKYEVLKKGKAIKLKPKEIQLLHFLLKNKNIVFTREQLLERVWGYNAFCTTRTVDLHIKRLRDKLYDKNNMWKIRTVWGIGYVLEVSRYAAEHDSAVQKDKTDVINS